MRVFIPLLLVAAFGCKTPAPAGASDVKIAGGVDMGPPGEFEPIVKFVVFKDGKHSACTATFVRPTILLTAAHCVVDKDLNVRPANVITVETRFVGVEEVYVNPGYLRPGQSWEEQIRHDLAWIRVRLSNDDLTDARHLEKILTIAETAPRAGALIRMVGYGMITKSEDAANEHAREGYNEIDEVNDYFIVINSKASVTKNGDVSSVGKSTDATTLWGDSGGPAMVAGELVGVTSNGGIGWFTAVTRFVNLNGPIGREFLKTLPN